jgi:hypothetical protein
MKIMVEFVEEGYWVTLVNLSSQNGSSRCRPFCSVWCVLELDRPVHQHDPEMRCTIVVSLSTAVVVFLVAGVHPHRQLVL